MNCRKWKDVAENICQHTIATESRQLQNGEGGIGEEWSWLGRQKQSVSKESTAVVSEARNKPTIHYERHSNNEFLKLFKTKHSLKNEKLLGLFNKRDIEITLNNSFYFPLLTIIMLMRYI